MDDSRDLPAAPGRAGTVVECLTCGRQATLGGGATRLPLVELTRRLRCSACGSRAVRADRPETPRDVARLLRERMRRGPSHA